MSLFKNHKTAAILGGVFGLLAPFIGLFLGLQVSVILGNILAFPSILMSFISGEPFGNFSGFFQILGLLISVALWSFIFAKVASFRK